MKLVVTHVSRGSDKFVVQFGAAVEGVRTAGAAPAPPVPMGYNGGGNGLTLLLDEEDARQYFPGDEYTLTLKKA